MYTSRSTAAPFFAVAVVAGRVSYIEKKDKKISFLIPLRSLIAFIRHSTDTIVAARTKMNDGRSITNDDEDEDAMVRSLTSADFYRNNS